MLSTMLIPLDLLFFWEGIVLKTCSFHLCMIKVSVDNFTVCCLQTHFVWSVQKLCSENMLRPFKVINDIPWFGTILIIDNSHNHTCSIDLTSVVSNILVQYLLLQVCNVATPCSNAPCMLSEICDCNWVVFCFSFCVLLALLAAFIVF